MHWCFSFRIKPVGAYEVMWVYCSVDVVNLLHVLATFCGHLQGRIMWRVYYRYQNQCTNTKYWFEVVRSVHHHTVQTNWPTRCNSFTSLSLDVLCRWTCFGGLHAHHQELTTALRASGFTVGAWWQQRCWLWSGRITGQITTNNAASTTLQR